MKNWNDFFEQEKQKPYFNKIVAFLDEEKEWRNSISTKRTYIKCF